MQGAYFVTGTDTEIGKTLVTCALLKMGGERGFHTLGLKPVAAGCEENADGHLVNSDALQIQSAMSVDRPYEVVNPCALRMAVSPHIAAVKENRVIDIPALANHCLQEAASGPDLTLVEGAGGWMAPLSDSETIEDLALALSLPVILVVGVRLGCLNMSLLTAARIQSVGVELAGWVGSVVEPNMQGVDANIAMLNRRLGAQCLGVIPCLDDATPSAAAAYLSW